MVDTHTYCEGKIQCSLHLNLVVQMLMALVWKADESHTCVSVVMLFHYTISVTTFNVYYSKHYWAHKCQGVRKMVQWPGYTMDDRVFCLDSMQQMFLFSTAFRPAVEHYRPATNQLYSQCRSTSTCSSTHLCLVACTGQHYFYRLFGRISKRAPYFDQQ